MHRRMGSTYEPTTSLSNATPSSSPYRFPLIAAEAPSYMQYPGVLGRYRSGGTVRDCLWSLLSLHTETVNAWTVLLSCVFSIIATAYLTSGHIPTETMPIFWVFTASSLIHTPVSVGFHLLMPMSIHVFGRWRYLDVCAIFVGATLFTFSLAYFVLPLWATILDTLLGTAITTLAIYSFWGTPGDHVLDHSKHALFVGSIIMCYWVPMAIALVRDAIHLQFTLSSAMVIGEFSSLSFGGWAFATGWPQKHSPGKFDVFGHSHQMLHVCAMIGHVCKFVFILSNCKRAMSYMPYL